MTCMAGLEKSTGKNNTFFAVLKYFLKFEYQYFGTISTYFTTGSWEARRRRRILTKDIRTGFQDPAFSLLRKHLSKYWRLGVTIQRWLLATFTLELHHLQYFQTDLKTIHPTCNEWYKRQILSPLTHTLHSLKVQLRPKNFRHLFHWQQLKQTSEIFLLQL